MILICSIAHYLKFIIRHNLLFTEDTGIEFGLMTLLFEEILVGTKNTKFTEEIELHLVRLERNSMTIDQNLN